MISDFLNNSARVLKWGNRVNKGHFPFQVVGAFILLSCGGSVCTEKDFIFLQ